MTTRMQTARALGGLRFVVRWTARLLAFAFLLLSCSHVFAQENKPEPEQVKPQEFRPGRYHCEVGGEYDFTLDLKTNGTYQISGTSHRVSRFVQSGDWKRKGDAILLSSKDISKTPFDFSRFYIDERFADTLDWGGRGMDFLMFKRVGPER